MRNANHQFTYEQQVMQKLRNHSPPEEFNDSSLIKLDSASVVFQPRTLQKELDMLIFRQREEFVSYDEFYQFLRKLYICEDPDQCLKIFRKLAGQAEVFYLQDFNRFIGKDIMKLELNQMTQCELILRIGMEIFDTLSDENNELDLKQTIYFIKEDLREDIDFLEIIDLFGFVQDIYSGMLISKVTLQGFFQKIAPQLRKALSSIVMRKIQQLIGFKRVQLHTRQKNQLIRNEQVKTDIQKLLQKNFQIQFEVEIEDKNSQHDSQEKIMNLIQSSKPKIRGWLQRLSLNKSNKWQLLFFQIDQASRILKAVKPEGIKKMHQILGSQFICLQELIVVPLQGVHHRKTNSLNSHHNDKDDQLRPVHTENPQTQLCPYSNVFIIQDNSSQKMTLIKSWDIREIEQIFLEIKSDIDKDQNYSGIVDICYINEEPLDKIRNKFKTYQFKEHLMVIKDQKIICYGSNIKHSIDLSKTYISNEKDLQFIPSHPFPFQLVIIESQIPPQIQQNSYIKVQKRVENQDDQNSVIMFQIEEDENENSDKEDKKGFFDQMYDKFKRKPTQKKKEIKLILAAESEPKRRQWIFSLNFYKSNQTDLGELVKHSNRSSFQTPLVSQANYTPKQSYIKSINNTQVVNIANNQNVFIGGNHTQINVGIFNLGADDDFYDVFKGSDTEVNNIFQRRQTPNQTQKQHCLTDPNEIQAKEQRLITQPSNGAQNTSKQIFSTSQVELWQKFLISFFKYLVKQKNHSIEEAQEPKIQAIYNRSLKINKQK